MREPRGLVRKNELAALGLVNRLPMHGYRLNQTVKELGLEHWTTLSRSSIYNALRRLAKRDAVSVTKEREGNAPERTVYHITRKGREMLREILRHALAYVGPEDRYFYLGLMFADALQGRQIKRLLEARCERIREAMEEEKRQMEEVDGPEPRRGHLLLMMQVGLRHSEVEVRVCREIIALVEKDPEYFRRVQGSFRDG
jgi:DNA-binding PadR family transcriptional regulator